MKDTSAICSFCHRDPSRYTCPRCGLFYCSSKCYSSEKHGNCSQQFFKEWVFNHLQTEQVEEATKESTMDILKRNMLFDGFDMAQAMASADFGEEDDDDTPDEDRFGDIDFTRDLDDNTAIEVLNRLTEKEKAEFDQLVRSGGIMNLIPMHEYWKPWWILYKPSLVEELGSDNCNGASAPSQIRGLPLIMKNILKLTELISRPPSKLVKYSVINVILGYCYVCRFFNGDHLEIAVDAAAELLAVSLTLSDAEKHFSDANSSVQSCIQFLINERSCPVAFVIQLMEDLKIILQSKQFVLRALSDLRAIFKSAIKQFTEDREKDQIKKFKSVTKTIEFYTSWCDEECYAKELAALVPDLDIELVSLKTNSLSLVSSQSFIVEKSNVKSPSIKLPVREV